MVKVMFIYPIAFEFPGLYQAISPFINIEVNKCLMGMSNQAVICEIFIIPQVFTANIDQNFLDFI